MPRARILKPDFFRSEDIGAMPPMARLLFQGLWTIADRDGRLLDRPRRIAADIFPYDEDPQVDENLNKLAARGLIQRYVVDGKSCIQIATFAKHQTPHYKEPSAGLPGPEQAQALSHTVGQSQGFTGQEPDKPTTCRPDPDPGMDPVRDPEGTKPDHALWNGWTWKSRYGQAWVAKYGGVAYGGGESVAKVCGQFDIQLAALPDAERMRAQARAPAMFAKYLGDRKLAAQKHPFRWFVDRFDALRTDSNGSPAVTGLERPPDAPVKLPAFLRDDWGKTP